MQQETKNRAHTVAKALIVLAAVVVLVAGLRAAQNVFLPVLLAFFLATVSYPITNALMKRKVPSFIAVLLTVLVDFAFVAGVIVMGFVFLQDLQEMWNKKYAAQFSQFIRNGSVDLAAKLDSWGVHEAKDKIDTAVNTNLANLQQIRFERIWDFGTGVLGHVMGFAGAALIFLILTVFMLSEAKNFGLRLTAISEARGPNFERFLAATRDIQRYLAIKTFASVVTGILAGLLCYVMDIDFWVLWGILAFGLNFIPVIGSLVAGIPPVFLALMADGIPAGLIVVGGYLVINNLIGNFLEPIFVGRRLGISTLVVIISVMFWGWVWGPLGMFLAVPIMMLVKVILAESEDFRWLAVAISSKKGQMQPDNLDQPEGLDRTSYTAAQPDP